LRQRKSIASGKRQVNALPSFLRDSGFCIEYTDNMGNLRFYEPDFVAITEDGTHYLIETKGLEDVNVANKDRAAHLWAENATALSGKPWAYLKVRQGEYNDLQATLFADLGVLGSH
jgi:type III restriction enzyme